jgi:hypothetical protein
VTQPPPEYGQGGQRRIRPYLSTPAAENPQGTVGGPPGTADSSPNRPRPFILTAGRVEATDPRIGLESQVVARVTGPVDHLTPPLRAILGVCAQPQSVAEISARLRLHLGVTQILVGDLWAAGLVEVHTVDLDATFDPDLILRVIDGIRAIR